MLFDIPPHMLRTSKTWGYMQTRKRICKTCSCWLHGSQNIIPEMHQTFIWVKLVILHPLRNRKLATVIMCGMQTLWMGRIWRGVRRQMGAFPVGPRLRHLSVSVHQEKEFADVQPAWHWQFGTGHRLTHPFSPSPPTGRPRPAAPVAVSLRTPALPPRERTLDCASQRLRHPPRQILSNQPIDPPRPPPVVRACRLCCSCGFQFRSLFVPTDCFPL
jgi:hypothetical protein